MTRILCLLLLVTSFATAQRRKPVRDLRLRPVPTLPKPGLVIGSNLFSLVEPEAGPSLSLEYRFSLHWSVLVDGTAFLYSNKYRDSSNGRGFRIQPEFRYYFAGKHRGFKGFFSAQGAYKQYTSQQNVMVRDRGSSRPIQDEKVFYQEHKHSLSGALNIGFQTRFGKAKHFMVELYTGLGIKHKFYKPDNRPANVVEPMVWLDLDFDEAGDYPHVPVVIKMGYCF